MSFSFLQRNVLPSEYASEEALVHIRPFGLRAPISPYQNPSLVTGNFARPYLWFGISYLHQKNTILTGFSISFNLDYNLLVY